MGYPKYEMPLDDKFRCRKRNYTYLCDVRQSLCCEFKVDLLITRKRKVYWEGVNLSNCD